MEELFGHVSKCFMGHVLHVDIELLHTQAMNLFASKLADVDPVEYFEKLSILLFGEVAESIVEFTLLT